MAVVTKVDAHAEAWLQHEGTDGGIVGTCEADFLTLEIEAGIEADDTGRPGDVEADGVVADVPKN